MQTANGFFDYILGAGVAVFPSLGFVYQYRLINARKCIGTFSINVCGVIFLSNFLRIAFFIYKEFSLVLLLQTFMNIIMQILLLKLCVKIMNSSSNFQKNLSQVEIISQSWIKDFWKWRNITNYFIFLGLSALLIFYIGYITKILDNKQVGETLGYASLAAQTFLLLPQLIQNLKQKQVIGISYAFVALNTFQDMIQLIFVVINVLLNLKKSQPLQFIIFNFLQVLTNILLIMQIAFYKKCCKKEEIQDHLYISQEHQNFQQDMHILNHQQTQKLFTIQVSIQSHQYITKSQLHVLKSKPQSRQATKLTPE